MLTTLVILAVLAVMYLLALQGRKNHPKMNTLRGWNYAHRGLHTEDKPENSLGAFRAALENGYGIELDIHLLADGNLAVLHDSLLKRTTGAEGRIENLTTQQLTDYRLEGTDEPIPAFSQVLELFDGKAPLIVELKSHAGNHAALCEAACKMLDTYHGPFCIESFDPRCIYWLRKHRPEIIRGQLIENSLKNKEPYPFILRLIMTLQLTNFLTKPDFVAHKFADRKFISNLLVHNLWGIQGVTWTLKTKGDFDTAVEEGYLPIFEGFIP